MKPDGFMTSDMLTNGEKDIDDLVEASQNSQGNRPRANGDALAVLHVK